MSEYTKIETARSIICGMCECYYLDGYCPETCDLEKCDWMEHLKEDAANVAPVVHGTWERQELAPPSYLFCSECGFPKKRGTWNYCPNCGARMDGAE